MLHNSKRRYGWLAIIFHWISALTVIALFVVGTWMVDLNYYSDWYKTAPHYHKSVGLLLVCLTLMRIVWKLTQVSPVSMGKPYEKKAAKATHLLLYLILILMFTSGFLISTADGRGIDVFNWFQVPSLGEWINDQEEIAGLIHEYTAYVLSGLFLLHSGAALKHHFFNKDTTLTRMITFKNKEEEQ